MVLPSSCFWKQCFGDDEGEMQKELKYSSFIVSILKLAVDSQEEPSPPHVQAGHQFLLKTL